MGANQKLRRRTVWLLIIVLAVGFGAVITRLAYLQLVQGEELQRRAIEQQLADTPISAKRGTIYDTKGKILAQSASVWQVVMAPAYFDDGAEGDEQRSLVASRLASILDLDEAELLEETKQNTYYVSVKRKVESEQKEQIIELQKELAEKYQKSGIISLLDDYKRYYPYSDLASSVIGFTGSEDQGLWGVEYQYNDYLSGTPGRIISAQNGIQTEMPFDYNQNIGAIDGSSVVLTIDETVQSIVEKYMKQGIIDNQVHERGVCIVMNVNNGEIVAMASVNGFDLNDPFTILPDQKKEIEAIDLDYLIKHDYFEEDEDPYKLSEEKKKELIEQAQNEAESAALARNWRNKAISDVRFSRWSPSRWRCRKASSTKTAASAVRARSSFMKTPSIAITPRVTAHRPIRNVCGTPATPVSFRSASWSAKPNSGSITRRSASPIRQVSTCPANPRTSSLSMTA